MHVAPSTSNQVWLRRFDPAVAAAPALVCLPHAGGSASFFHPFSAALAPAIDVLAVQYPGRQDRRLDPCLDSVPALAAAVCAVLDAEPGLDDFAFFGHSMGAIVGFEVARLMERRPGRRPRRLFASGRRAPSRARRERAHTLTDDGLVAEVSALGGTDPRVLSDPELRAMVLPTIRSDYRAIETYRCVPGATVSCPVTVLTGGSDPRTSADEAADWSLHTTGGCRVETLVGGHFFLLERREEVAGIVRRALL